MQNSRSFQGLCPLNPHQGFALDPLGAHSAPRPLAGISNDPYRAFSMIALPRQQFYTGPQFCCTPPNRRTSHQNNRRKTSAGGCVTQGCVFRHNVSSLRHRTNPRDSNVVGLFCDAGCNLSCPTKPQKLKKQSV